MSKQCTHDFGDHVCGEPSGHPLHAGDGFHDTSERDVNQLNYDCGYDVSYEGDPLWPVVTCNCHEFDSD